MHIENETETTDKTREARGAVFGMIGAVLTWMGAFVIIVTALEASRYVLHLLR